MNMKLIGERGVLKCKSMAVSIHKFHQFYLFYAPHRILIIYIIQPLPLRHGSTSLELQSNLCNAAMISAHFWRDQRVSKKYDIPAHR